MSGSSLPRWTKPWKIAAIAIAVFGFVLGYSAAAGGPFCGSLGTCLERVIAQGLAGFKAAALVPGALTSALLGGFVYLVFLVVAWFRNSRPDLFSERPPSSAEPVASTPRVVPALRARPAPLVLAVGLAIAWAVLSVGPGTLLDDVGEAIPKDLTALTVCKANQPADAACRTQGIEALLATPGDPSCGNISIDGYHVAPATLGTDGMCHAHVDGSADDLFEDLLRAIRNGVLAFVVVGAAILIWPRLKQAGTSGA